LFTPEKVDEGVTKTKNLSTINKVMLRDPKVTPSFCWKYLVGGCSNLPIDLCQGN